jgi:hypothetical protein
MTQPRAASIAFDNGALFIRRQPADEVFNRRDTRAWERTFGRYGIVDKRSLNQIPPELRDEFRTRILVDDVAVR